jgi:hypothetical protein
LTEVDRGAFGFTLLQQAGTKILMGKRVFGGDLYRLPQRFDCRI